MFKKSLALLAFAAFFSPTYASPTPRQSVNLFICDTEGGGQYATTADQYPGKCRQAPDMPSDWHPLLIPKDNKSVIYLDINHVKWKGKIAEVAFVILPIDSSKAVLVDASSVAQFDVLARRYLYCDSAQQQTFSLELYRNFRTNPELIKRFDNANRPMTPIGASNTAESIAFALVCSHDYEKLPVYKATTR